jgi:hypothetical protein
MIICLENHEKEQVHASVWTRVCFGRIPPDFEEAKAKP